MPISIIDTRISDDGFVEKATLAIFDDTIDVIINGNYKQPYLHDATIWELFDASARFDTIVYFDNANELLDLIYNHYFNK